MRILCKSLSSRKYCETEDMREVERDITVQLLVPRSHLDGVPETSYVIRGVRASSPPPVPASRILVEQA